MTISIDTVSLQKAVFNLIEKVTGESNILTSPQVFLKAFNGNHAKALFFSQILYWSDKTTRKDGWFFKSYSDWKKELFISPYQIRKFSNELKSEGLIKFRNGMANGVKTVHYFVCRESLYYWIVKNFNNGLLNNLTIESEIFLQPITKTTSQTTTETNKIIYITLPRDDEPFLSFYLKAHQHYLHREHARVTKEQLEKIESDIWTIKEYDVEFEEWKDKVIEHFENLPATNNGNILAFLAASMRHFEVNLYY